MTDLLPRRRPELAAHLGATREEVDQAIHRAGLRPVGGRHGKLYDTGQVRVALAGGPVVEPQPTPDPPVVTVEPEPQPVAPETPPDPADVRPAAPSEDVIDLRQAAGLLGIAKASAWELVKRRTLVAAGTLKGGKKTIVVRRGDVEALILRRQQKAAATAARLAEKAARAPKTTSGHPAPPRPPRATALLPEEKDALVASFLRGKATAEAEVVKLKSELAAEFKQTMTLRAEVARMELSARKAQQPPTWEAEAPPPGLDALTAPLLDADAGLSRFNCLPAQDRAELAASALTGAVVRLTAALRGDYRIDWSFVGEDITIFLDECLGELRVALVDRDLTLAELQERR